MNKWLMILDQVGYSTLRAALPPPQLPSLVPLALDYVPRTTPVGHATLSTGLWPAQHLVQGRSWCEVDRGRVHRIHRVAQLPHVFPVEGTVFEPIHRHSLAHRLRDHPAHQDAAIVAVATKDFLPFLLGAWHTDVSVYPRTTRPQYVGGDFAIDIVLDAMTARGERAIARARTAIDATVGMMLESSASSLPAGWCVRWLEPVRGQLGKLHVRHAMRWTLPRAWGDTRPLIEQVWRQFIDEHIIDVDQLYASIAQQLVVGCEAKHQIVLQSAVATDTYGHLYGPSSPSYRRALTAGIDRVHALHARGWSVLVTSDHGGRDTPHAWRLMDHTLDTGGAQIPLPAMLKVVVEGDHAVGYGLGTSALMQRANLSVVPPQLVPITGIPSSLRTHSFHETQMPACVVLPAHDALITEKISPPTSGGSHGGCVDETGAFSKIDGEVPLWWLGSPTSPPPLDLRGVASFFTSLR